MRMNDRLSFPDLWRGVKEKLVGESDRLLKY